MEVPNLQSIIPILERNGVKFAGLFGSHAKGSHGEDSDVDILVKFNKPQGLIKIAGLQLELSDVLKKRVDLVTEGALSPYIKDSVLKDMRVFYGSR